VHAKMWRVVIDCMVILEALTNCKELYRIALNANLRQTDRQTAPWISAGNVLGFVYALFPLHLDIRRVYARNATDLLRIERCKQCNKCSLRNAKTAELRLAIYEERIMSRARFSY